MREIGRETLDRLVVGQFGSGAGPSISPGDDRAGRYWKVVDDSIPLGVRIALVTGRPLLLEGPSGSGKSSLARALAETLGWTYYESVIDSRTELETLVGAVDHVRRLHEAEFAARTDRLFDGDPAAFLRPGVLWWAFDPETAEEAGKRHRDPGLAPVEQNQAEPGAVVLVDEIDKADPDLPNNLLVPFGSMQLTVEARPQPVSATRPVLLCVTSNRERDLPPAFLRRCVTLALDHPEPDQLVEIATHHVAGPEAAAMARIVRRRFLGEGQTMSAAEFVDAVRAAVKLGLDPSGEGEQWDSVQRLFDATTERRQW